MRKTQPQDTTTRMSRPDEFDCQLPQDVLRELRKPRRARILAPPPPPPPPAPPDRAGWMRHPRAGTALGTCALLLIVALAGLANWLSKTPETGHQPKPATLQPAPAASSEVPAPRAVLVPLTVKRAALWRLPGQKLGVYKWYELPLAWGGGTVRARYMGTKEHFSQMPPNPIPGDLWNVVEGNASWVYCTPAGYDHNAWIDP
jgi:hypothetical protein